MEGAPLRQERRGRPAAPARASLLAAGVGGGLLVIAAPLFSSAVMWSVFDPGSVPTAVLVAMAAAATCAPVAVTAAIAARRRAAVRVSVLLVAVPQAVLWAPLLLLGVLGRR